VKVGRAQCERETPPIAQPAGLDGGSVTVARAALAESDLPADVRAAAITLLGELDAAPAVAK